SWAAMYRPALLGSTIFALRGHSPVRSGSRITGRTCPRCNAVSAAIVPRIVSVSRGSSKWRPLPGCKRNPSPDYVQTNDYVQANDPDDLYRVAGVALRLQWPGQRDGGTRFRG